MLRKYGIMGHVKPVTKLIMPNHITIHPKRYVKPVRVQRRIGMEQNVLQRVRQKNRHTIQTKSVLHVIKSVQAHRYGTVPIKNVSLVLHKIMLNLIGIHHQKHVQPVRQRHRTGMVQNVWQRVRQKNRHTIQIKFVCHVIKSVQVHLLGIQPKRNVQRAMLLIMLNLIGIPQLKLVKLVRVVHHIGMVRSVWQNVRMRNQPTIRIKFV